MASNDNSVQPKLSNVTVGTTAVTLNTSSLQVAMFTVSNPNAVALYVGDSSVSSTKYNTKITAGTNVTFGPIKLSQSQTQQLDLPSFFVRATAAAQTAVVTTYIKGSTGGAY